ncbi:MAG: hypothetical protein ABSG01_00165 [Anaerolineales bacterium]|jgi:hypothetical protein
MSDEDYFDDQMIGLNDDPDGGEFDGDEFNDDEEKDWEDDDLDDGDQEDKASDDDNADEEFEKDKEILGSDISKPKVGYCHICGAQVIVDELPGSISRDAFEQFGLCLNCQWGFFMDNGGHF